MLPTRIICSISRLRHNLSSSSRVLDRALKFSSSPSDPDAPNVETNSSNSTLGQIGSNYQIFTEKDSEVIFDIYEERNKYANLLETECEEEPSPFEGINLERGINGVYEIEELVDVLRRENADNIFVAKVPKEIEFVQHICVVSGRSYKHMLAMAQFVRRVYKQKRHDKDLIPKIEGEKSKDWMAIDLGNIALHIFSREARLVYDLDSLWSVGPEYDAECNKQDPVAEMLEKHSIYLQDLQPAN